MAIAYESGARWASYNVIKQNIITTNVIIKLALKVMRNLLLIEVTHT